ncbi:hypothetical protein HUB97_15940 [Halorubraceae archaeon YAN]|nr:hypothetical protein [Halorubraceae archaeon YAN]
MKETSVTVTCSECEYESVFQKLSDARVELAAHETETGHVVDWSIEKLSAGVEKAGDDAGVCGIPGLENPKTPLIRF